MPPPREAFQALIFDLDGLLVDSEPIWFQVESGFLAELGHRWTPEQARACMGRGTPNTLRMWQEQLGVDIDIERDTEQIIDRVIARADEIPWQPGAEAILEAGRQRGLSMAVASSSPLRLIHAVLDVKNVRAVFQVVVSAQQVARTKPAPDVFLLAADRLGASPSRCLVLEDSLPGVQAACNAGARVAAVPSVPDPRVERLAHWTLPNLGQAVHLLPPLG